MYYVMFQGEIVLYFTFMKEQQKNIYIFQFKVNEAKSQSIQSDCLNENALSTSFEEEK